MLVLLILGGTHLLFKDGQHYTWSKVTITVHNIIVGRLWAEIHGETVIKNHNTNYTCRMRYEAHSYFSRDPDRQVRNFLPTFSSIQTSPSNRNSLVCCCRAIGLCLFVAKSVSPNQWAILLICHLR